MSSEGELKKRLGVYTYDYIIVSLDKKTQEQRGRLSTYWRDIGNEIKRFETQTSAEKYLNENINSLDEQYIWKVKKESHLNWVEGENIIDEAKKDFPYPDIRIDIVDNEDYAKGFQDAHDKWCRKFEKWFGE